jgi:hypothetical protein
VRLQKYDAIGMNFVPEKQNVNCKVYEKIIKGLLS